MDQEIWDQLCARLRSYVNPSEFQTWFEPLSMKIEGEQLVLLVPNHFFAQWIQDRYQQVVLEAIRQTTGSPMSLSFETTQDLTPVVHSISSNERNQPISLLNQRYKFNNFVVGPCNELAFAASQAVACEPGKQYNPLFLFGGAGLGKTHLLIAAGNEIIERFPGKRVQYCSSEMFANELIQAVRFDSIAAFRDRYRMVDCLLLDDVHFISGRERTQEEFFHTFNSLFDAGKQIILTSDKMPRDIASLEKRLTSRFEWGLLADMQPPDKETMVAILLKKAAEKGIDLSREVAFMLASQPESNVRVLEGYLNRVVAVSRFQQCEVTPDLVNRIMGPLVGERKVTIDEIIKAVAAHYGVQESDIKGSRKTRDITVPRQVAMYLSRNLTGASFPEIGKAFGNKDHSTVVKGVQKIKRQLGTDHDLAARVRALDWSLRERGKSRDSWLEIGGDKKSGELGG